MKSNNFNKKPFFSVVTVVKNDENNIQRTLISVLNQEFKNFEYIIIDGQSKDKTLTIIDQYKKDISHIISEPDSGIYFAMNKGANLANGEFLVFVNSGDILTKKALLIIHDKINQNPKIDFIFGTVKRHYTKDTILKFGFDKKKLFYNFDFATSHSTGFYIRNSIFKKIGLFNTKYKCSADYDIYYKSIIIYNLAGSSTEKHELIGEVSSGGFSSTISPFEHIIEEIKIRIDNGQNKFFIFLIFLNALLKYFFKKFQFN